MFDVLKFFHKHVFKRFFQPVYNGLCSSLKRHYMENGYKRSKSKNIFNKGSTFYAQVLEKSISVTYMCA